MGWTDAEARARVARLEERLSELERRGDEDALAAVSGVVEVYGEALRRIAGSVGAQRLAADELVGQLLLIHDLGPRPLAERVTEALDGVRPYLAQHGGGVELVAVEGDSVRLRLQGHCHGCPSSTATLKLAVEDAIREAAPEIAHIDAEGAVEPPPTGVPLPMAGAGAALPTTAAGVALPMAGALPVVEVTPPDLVCPIPGTRP
jgi:Fe-S cluster biogenesis protein NfuA